MSDLHDVWKNMSGVYERQAHWWDANRSALGVEKVWLDRFACHLPKGGRVLDLGCGTGEPVASYLLQSGFKVVGVDYSASMIDIAKRRFPNVQWIVAEMTNFTSDAPFHGVIGWDSFFHLTQDKQRTLLSRLCEWMPREGVFMATVGPNEGEVLGTVGGEDVYHSSLSEAEYRRLLADGGFLDVTFVAEDPDCADRSILLASTKLKLQHGEN